MGQYKVPQDVEAEDKLIGFLTLKQFIYTVIGLGWGFVSFQLLKSVPFIFLLVGVPPAGIFLMLGLIQRQGQPFETYFVALVSFYFKPRHRLWHKDPIVEVFKLEAPKIISHENQRNPAEVRSQLENIAAIVDTRGWSAKQPEVQEPELNSILADEQRITVPDAPIADVATDSDEVGLADDILDFQHNPNAENLGALIKDAEKTIREEAMQKMQASAKEAPKPTASSTPTPAPKASAAQSTSEMTPNPVAGILKLAMENNELTVSQVAAQAQKQVVVPEGQTINLRPAAPVVQPKVEG